ncbi:hypothetical protein [Rickettsiella endosymbiont of Rhagonycha lignosa]|uniref:hypothetical protein n=1 Tax=Rickettsiella endosymbiont of Rhagonycha lignosa TaxID=3077937 RepID=UPI00313E0239
MLIKFSAFTATLLETLSFYNELKCSPVTENTLDLTRIKQLKGCRTTLVQDCLKIIQKLDVLAKTACDEKNYALANINTLIEALNHYKISCERYPRLKDFLNIIPDNMSGIVGFFIIASALASITFPPVAVIPLFIFSWVLMDLFFNNREAAKNLQETLYNVEDELRTIDAADNILKIKVQATPTAVQTPSSSQAISIPGPSNRRDYSPCFYGSIENKPINQDETHANQLASSLTST